MGAEKHRIEVFGLITDYTFHQAKVTAEVNIFSNCFCYIS